VVDLPAEQVAAARADPAAGTLAKANAVDHFGLAQAFRELSDYHFMGLLDLAALYAEALVLADVLHGAFPVLAVHYEIVVEADEGQADAVAAWLKAAMVAAMAPLINPRPRRGRGAGGPHPGRGLSRPRRHGN
jgi:hypothetical protein